MTALTGDGGCSHGNSAPRAVLPRRAESCAPVLELARGRGCTGACTGALLGPRGVGHGRAVGAVQGVRTREEDPKLKGEKVMGSKDFCSVPKAPGY